MRFPTALRILLCLFIIYTKRLIIALNEKKYGLPPSRSTDYVAFNGFWKPFQKTSMNFEVHPQLIEHLVKIIAFVLLLCQLPTTKLRIQRVLRTFTKRYETILECLSIILTATLVYFWATYSMYIYHKKVEHGNMIPYTLFLLLVFDPLETASDKWYTWTLRSAVGCYYAVSGFAKLRSENWNPPNVTNIIVSTALRHYKGLWMTLNMGTFTKTYFLVLTHLTWFVEMFPIVPSVLNFIVNCTENQRARGVIDLLWALSSLMLICFHIGVHWETNIKFFYMFHVMNVIPFVFQQKDCKKKHTSRIQQGWKGVCFLAWVCLLTTIASDPGPNAWPIGSMPQFINRARDFTTVYLVSDGKQCFKGSYRMNFGVFNDKKVLAAYCTPPCRSGGPLELLQCTISWKMENSGEIQFNFSPCQIVQSFGHRLNSTFRTYNFNSNDRNLCKVVVSVVSPPRSEACCDEYCVDEPCSYYGSSGCGSDQYETWRSVAPSSCGEPVSTCAACPAGRRKTVGCSRGGVEACCSADLWDNNTQTCQWPTASCPADYWCPGDGSLHGPCPEGSTGLTGQTTEAGACELPNKRTESCCDGDCSDSDGCSYYGYIGCGANQYETGRLTCPGICSGQCSACADCPPGRHKAAGCSRGGVEACLTSSPARDEGYVSGKKMEKDTSTNCLTERTSSPL